MANREQLEKIKQDVKMTRRDLAVSPSNEITLHMDIMLNSMDYLIKQAERVQELEEQKLALIEEMGQVDERFLESEYQNKKLREALERNFEPQTKQSNYQ